MSKVLVSNVDESGIAPGDWVRFWWPEHQQITMPGGTTVYSDKAIGTKLMLGIVVDVGRRPDNVPAAKVLVDHEEGVGMVVPTLVLDKAEVS